MSEELKQIDYLDETGEQIREVLGKPPVWVIRWGITIVFIFMAVLISLSFIIRYPDVIPARIVLTTLTPPSGIIAKESGTIQELLVEENALVKAGDRLVILENTANAQHMFELQKILGKNPEYTSAMYSQINQKFDLGDWQVHYADFLNEFEKFLFFQKQNANAKESTSIQLELNEYKTLIEKQNKQRQACKEEVAVLQNNFERNQQLFKEKLVPAQVLEAIQGELLSAKRSCGEIDLDISNAQIQIASLLKNLTQLDLKDEEKQKQLELNLANQHKKLLSHLNSWEEKYILQAPIDGKVSFFKIWSEYQYVEKGQEVMVVVPDSTQAIIGKVLIDVKNSGKAQVGQKINIQLDNYPYQEYGMVIGKVAFISLIPRESQYILEVSLPEGLKTSYGKELEFKQELQGYAEIITEDITLINRILYQLKSVFKNQ